MGVLEPRDSAWAANIVFHSKSSLGTRCTTNFQVVNSHTEADQYLMEGVKETLDYLSMQYVLYDIDLKYVFYQVKIDDESRHLTAVRTVDGLFQYTRLAQGFKNSPSVFQRVVNHTLSKDKDQNVWAFMMRDL